MEEKKQHILKHVGELYLKFGIRSVTMDDVASEFGMSKKTLYEYFKDKAELVSQVIDFYLENPKFNLNETENGNAIDSYFALRAHVVNILKYFNNNIEFDLKKQYPSLYCRVHKFKRERIFKSTVSNIERGIKDGVYRDKIDVELIAKLQVGRMLYTLNPENEIFNEAEITNIDLFDKVIDYHMHAICTPKGIEYFRKQLNKTTNEDKN